ncbi:hypothetical protein, partial [Streptomyces sp. NPDC059742]|uniref:hypothetical protein n=1 Tax=Streptomyces sp. NPDC059742 TaxID=3346927 RepID=UPI003664433B
MITSKNSPAGTRVRATPYAPCPVPTMAAVAPGVPSFPKIRGTQAPPGNASPTAVGYLNVTDFAPSTAFLATRSASPA